jgi:hypothetical protein
MFKKVRIQNFRQFKDLTLDNLAQINLITGANNTGKTSLLEALLLHVSPTNPEMVLTIARLREMETVSTDGPGAWGWIFRNGINSDPIIIESQDSMNNRVTQTIATSRGLQFPQTNFPPANGSSGTYEPVITTSGRPLHSLFFGYEDLQGHRGASRMRLDGGIASIEHEAGEFSFKSFYLATRSASPTSNARIFSRVVLANQEEDIVSALQLVDTRLRRLRVLDTGAGPSVHADFGDGRFLPVSVGGGGMNRVLTLVSAIVDTAGGVILIDEIEDGLHYGVLPDVWKVIVQTALAHDVQIVATTHSLEAISAAVKGSEEHEGSLGFFRLEREGDRIEVVQGSDSRLRSAVAVGFELR